jgi:TldD protein
MNLAVAGQPGMRPLRPFRRRIWATNYVAAIRILSFGFPSIVFAGGDGSDPLSRELEQDVVLRALVDEQRRCHKGLAMPGLPSPYFIEYALIDGQTFQVMAELGSISSRNDYRTRRLRADVRVGSYQLDNGNFRGSGGGSGEVPVPIEDDYTAIRQAAWWSSDRQYKASVETLAEKKAFMASRIMDEKPDDFSREEPTVSLDDRIALTVEREALEQLASQLSGTFREFPELKETSVTVLGVAGHKYLVNTEGTRIRTSVRRYSIWMTARTQAEDGMELQSAVQHEVRRFASLPPRSELVQQARDMAEQLIGVSRAPVLAAYSGPVLFEPEAAANFFARHLGGRFNGGQRPVGTRANPDDFANKLNRRILPRFAAVVDDPTQETVFGVGAMGHYRFDDQGVPAQRVTLVEGGRLLNLLMSRNPSREFPKSNGHGRGNFAPRASVGSLVVSGSQPASDEALRKELIDSFLDEGLEFGIRIAALGSVGGGGRGGDGGGSPLVMFKVFPDGREELVRGAEFARVDLKAFKRILAFGERAHVLNFVGVAGQTVAAPAMLFEELDLARIDRDFTKPPILAPPLARQ